MKNFLLTVIAVVVGMLAYEKFVKGVSFTNPFVKGNKEIAPRLYTVEDQVNANLNKGGLN